MEADPLSDRHGNCTCHSLPDAVHRLLSRHSASRTSEASSAFDLLPTRSIKKGEKNALSAASRDAANSPCFLSK